MDSSVHSRHIKLAVLVLLFLMVNAAPHDFQVATALPVVAPARSLLSLEGTTRRHLALQPSVQGVVEEEKKWQQTVEQRWSDCKVGPDNYKYYFLGVPAAGTRKLIIDVKKGWGMEGGPLLCLRRGGPPLPANDTAEPLLVAAGAAGWAANSSFMSACAWFTTNARIVFSEEHVLHGPWWLGAFTDPSDTRFQSKMIQRGPVYPFSINVTMAGCGEGPGCELETSASSPASARTVQSSQAAHAAPTSGAPPSSLVEALLQGPQAALSALESSLSWSKWRAAVLSAAHAESSTPSQCFPWNASFPLYIASATATLSITIELLPNTESSAAASYSAWLRWGALPVISNSSFSTPPDQSRSPSTGFTTGRLSMQGLPMRIGWWYLRLAGGDEARDAHFCIQKWSVTSTSCAEGRAGSNCAWPLVHLQRVLTGPRLSALYQPASVPQPPSSSGGWLPAMFNASETGGSSAAGQWAFFAFTVPETAAGQTLTLEARWRASTGVSERIHLYAKLGAAPTQDKFDLAARFNGTYKSTGLHGQDGHTGVSDGPREGGVSRGDTAGLQLVPQYPAPGVWVAALFLAPVPHLEHPRPNLDWEALPPGVGSEHLSVEVRIRSGGCPQDCSGWGDCATFLDEGMAQPWSTCECDRTHGGGDCSVEVLSPGQESRHVLALTLSNVAAMPAAAWAYSHQAYPEWVVFTLGGLASAVYHMCDAGGLCLAQYGTLQFADFLLSFLAVVLTCLYLAPLPPSAAAAAQLGTTLLLAVLAKDNATSGWSLAVVAVLGALALVLGWGLEAWMARHQKPHGDPPWTGCLRQLLQGNRERCGPLLPCPGAALAWFSRRYRWPFLLAGLAMLGLAAAAWTLEAGPTYWIWHSLWHVAIFMCPFFLLSATTPTARIQGAAAQEYLRVQQAEREPSTLDHELRMIVEPPHMDLAGMPHAASQE